MIESGRHSNSVRVDRKAEMLQMRFGLEENKNWRTKTGYDE
jgi:hypothetical protein